MTRKVGLAAWLVLIGQAAFAKLAWPQTFAPLMQPRTAPACLPKASSLGADETLHLRLRCLLARLSVGTAEAVADEGQDVHHQVDDWNPHLSPPPVDMKLLNAQQHPQPGDRYNSRS